MLVREQGITLAGMSPEAFIEPVTTDVLRREIYHTLNGWGEKILRDPEIINNRFYQAYAVLSYCRMLHDLYRGQAGSKLAGAEWIIYHGFAKEWDGLIECSWARRTNPANWVGLPADTEDFESTLKFIRYIMGLSQQFIESQQCAKPIKDIRS
ncbi:MAG: aminoglycoside adenylyltransferase domain-containing protein [Armatimonadota bacterium]